MALNKNKLRRSLLKLFRDVYDIVTMPVAVALLTHSNHVHPAYRAGWLRRMWLGARMWYNFMRMTSGTSWRAHLVMAMKLLETPPNREGVVVECGCWKGGATVNLSLACRMVGRKLMVYDSFEGLPPPEPGDLIAERSFRKGFVPGVYGGALEEVKANVSRFGAPEVCSFHKGWFKDTLIDHTDPVVLAFWDVDLYASLHDCLINLWPHIVDEGYVFMDEYREIEYCSVFYSEKYWDKYFSSAPPGLIGIGTGIQVGMFYTDPSIGFRDISPQFAQSVGYCQKGVRRCIWEFYPDERDEDAADDAA